jgi:glyoxalase family protein
MTSAETPRNATSCASTISNGTVRAMKLEGVHHVTCITGDAPQNVEYYTGTLGLRLVKKSVNQDDPTVYHLFYADEKGSPGSDITFFEYPNAAPGRAGAGMVHRIAWRVASTDALDFWERRAGGERGDGFVRFADPEGLEHELFVVETDDPPLVADHHEIPKELALQGFDGVRAYSANPEASRAALEETLAFEPAGDNTWEARGAERGGFYAYDRAPEEPGAMGAGAVHHVAWASTMDDHEEWQRRVAAAGLRPTPIIDRFWFRSIYFREPSGVLFEVATLGPGFDVDEDPEHLGEALVLPPDFEHLRDELERVLTPLPKSRARSATEA